MCGAVICKFFGGGVLYWGFSFPFRVWSLAHGFKEESSGRLWHLNSLCWHQFLQLWINWELLGGIPGNKISGEGRVCLVPGWASKHESRKVISVSALQLIDEALERTECSQPRSQLVNGNLASRRLLSHHLHSSMDGFS